MSKSKNILSIINKEQSFDGTISSKGMLQIYGTVKGEIVGETVVIAQGGMVQADIKVVDITIGGTFEGEIRASNRLEIHSTGNCTGRVVCRTLVVEAGGILNAEITCISALDTESEKKLLTAP